MRSGPVLFAALLTISLTACGGSAAQNYVRTPATTVDQDMRTALSSLKSVHIHTSQQDTGGTFTMDMSVDNAGRCSGTLTEGGQQLALVGVSPTQLYVKASAAFWSQTENVKPAAAVALADKWIYGFPNGQFSNICAISSLVKSFTTNTISADKAKVLGKTIVGRVDAVDLQISVGGSPVTIAVSAAAPHRPLQVISAGGKRTTVLSQFDVPLHTTPPAGAEDITNLQGKK